MKVIMDKLSEAMGDYLKRIYMTEQDKIKVSTSVLAAQLHITPASVSGMIKKLSKLNFIRYTPYYGVRLSNRGRKIALKLIRHHRLIELYLSKILGLSWDKVHEEAERWEHILSEDVEARMDAVLGYPNRDPHGAPIPTVNGIMNVESGSCLVDIEPGKTVEIIEVSDHNPDLLRYLSKIKLSLKDKLHIVQVAPFKGPLTISIDNQELILGHQVAHHIFVHECTKR